MRMKKLAVVVDLPCKVRVVLASRLENHLQRYQRCPSHPFRGRTTYFGAICQLMGGKIDLAERAFAYKLVKLVVADMAELCRAKFTEGENE